MIPKPPLPRDLIAEIERITVQLDALDYYALLGVSRVASAEEIRAAFHTQTKRFHPDRWATRELGPYQRRMEAIFSRVSEAYETLRDATRRREYDRALSAVRGEPRPSAAPTPVSSTTVSSTPPQAPGRQTPRTPTQADLAAAQRLMREMRARKDATQPKIDLASAASKPTTSPPAASVAPAPVMVGGKMRPRILVVEDDESVCKLVARLLAEIGEVETASDGVMALAIIQRGPIPSLVVTDVMMPNMDGLELARRLKKEPSTTRIPIVMLTAKNGPRDVIEGVNAGARYYVQKPFKADELKSRVKKALGL